MRTFKELSSFAAALSLCFVVGCAATDDDVTVGEAIDDTVITARVKAALIDNESLSANEINVETREGVVQLSGFVDDRSDIAEAGEVTEDIEGVRSVKNDLTLK
jgi:osmotically-inducible protein OsmY